MYSAISTVLPTHNRAHLLKRAIVSVLDQLEDQDELIVVDDGSTDHTQDVVSEFDSRLKYLRIHRSGAGAARNIGIKNSKNHLVAFIDSDDEWLPEKMAIQRPFMLKMPDLLFCFTNFSFKENAELGGQHKRFNLVSWSKDVRPWEQILARGQRISTIIKLPEDMEDFNFHTGSMCKLELCANYIGPIHQTKVDVT